MSDSLRDQLLKAGFNEKKAKPQAKSRRRGKPQQANHNTTKADNKTPKQPQEVVAYTDVPAATPKRKKSKKAPAVKSRSGSWGTRGGTTQANNTSDNAAQQQKAPADGTSSRVHELIKSSMIKQHRGDAMYRFTWQNKIREIGVTEKIRQQLADGELAITWLDGNTCIIPVDCVANIREINDKWRLVINEQTGDSQDYDDHPVPDDLIW